ncbi:RNA polymerase sigma-70 factor (ECF subfamily) [Kitasatospora sp. MAA4]|uniref:RNA polymerase sigma factor SigM n=1 Tax=Kitasatospora sp. MAA4 TaxID=3035093 RepID=UPI00247602DC|nr:RNA polymerase sigma factor SigM [Kitasatospora sp. MAA4]MDH6134607.1 RNA polymerase sigma-70 factor (ECF subfamily) [Kitasatospora sp. MAA4]
MAEPTRQQLSEAAETTDAELLARHVGGDQAAFGVLVARHRDRLWAVAVRTLGDREEAADALQDALVSAFRAAHTFQGRSAVTTWLHRIVVNACLDRARRTATRRTGSLDDDPQQLDSLVGSAEPTDALVVRQELRRELASALDTLPVDQRAAIVLVDMQGYPVAEAAEVLGVPVGTVKSRCARGRARLLPLVRHLRGGDVSRETSTRPRPPGNPTGSGSVPSGDPGIPVHELSLEGDATPR